MNPGGCRTGPPSSATSWGRVLKLSLYKDTGRFIITLDKGQRWSQIENKPM